MKYDVLLFQYFNSFAGQSNIFDMFIVFAANYLQYFVAVAIILWLWERRAALYHEALGVVSTIILSRGLFTEAIRYFYPKPRPFEIFDVHQVINHSAGGALPSGHAAFFFALGAAVFIYDKKLGSGLLVAAILISIARVIGGVHWPADILAGAIVGVISAVLVYYGKRFFEKE